MVLIKKNIEYKVYFLKKRMKWQTYLLLYDQVGSVILFYIWI